MRLAARYYQKHMNACWQLNEFIMFLTGHYCFYIMDNDAQMLEGICHLHLQPAKMLAILQA